MGPIEHQNKPNKADKFRLLCLSDLDQRTAAARRSRDLVSKLEADLGGTAALSEGQRQLIQRAAVLGALIEDCEAHWIGGEPVEMGRYLSAINSQRRVLATLGLERRARDVTPSLAAYLLSGKGGS